MYCSHCGEKIIEVNGRRICRRCGQPVEQVQYSNGGSTQYSIPNQNQDNELNQRARVRQEETAELHRMIRYFSQKNAQYAEYDRVSSMLSYASFGAPVGLLVGGIIGVVLSITALITSSSTKLSELIFMSVISLLGSVAMIVGFSLSKNARRKNYEKFTVRFEELSNELYQHYVNYGYCLVSAEYTNPENLKSILQTIESGRADTIKEAINILVEDAHRTSMQGYAARTAASSAAAARAATASAVFSAANFFKKR